MKNINKTKTLSEYLNSFTFGDNVSKGKSLSGAIKQSTLFSFWKDIVGEKLAQHSKPTKIKYSKLYVSAKSPVLIQELNLLKEKIIKKANTYSGALGFKINDIVFDYKNYYKNIPKELQQEDMPEYFNNEDIVDYKVSENFINEIKQHISKINLLNEEQKNKLIDKIINVNKAKIKQQQKLDK